MIADLTAGDRIQVRGAGFAGFTFSRIGDHLRLADGQNVTVPGFNGRLAVEQASGNVVLRALTHDAGLNDFNGDGHSDILRARDGAVSSWTVAGNGRADRLGVNSFFAAVDASWRVQELLDFNGDGRSDVLWRNADGSIAVWNAINRGFDQRSYLRAPIGSEWRIAAAGDLNGDGLDDLLWQRADGAISSWTSTGAGFAENSFSRDRIDAGWRVAALGDVNGDGRDDIVWRNVDGSVSVWTANGAGAAVGFAEAGALAAPDASWRIAGVADLNGDGRDDIVWRNTNGALSTWLANDGGFDQNAFFDGSDGNDWRIEQLGDFDADGRADILWRRDTGAISIWESNGVGFDRNTLFNGGPTVDWSVQGHDVALL